MTIEELKKIQDGLKRMMIAMATYTCDGKRVIEILAPAISFIGEKISCQSITDAEVQRAIAYQQKHIDEEMFAWEHTDDEWKCESGAEEQYEDFIHYHDLAITALRQMRTEPCEWCKNNDVGMISINESRKEADANYCPNCGRKLR